MICRYLPDEMVMLFIAALEAQQATLLPIYPKVMIKQGIIQTLQIVVGHGSRNPGVV